MASHLFNGIRSFAQTKSIFVRGTQRLFSLNICSEKQFSFTRGPLKISRWPFHSCTIFEAYLKVPYDFLKFNFSVLCSEWFNNMKKKMTLQPTDWSFLIFSLKLDLKPFFGGLFGLKNKVYTWESSCFYRRPLTVINLKVLHISWNDLTIKWDVLVWNDLTMERSDRIAGLHVTSRRPCWSSRTKAFLSSGN